jgi:hypothetical protein
MNQQEDLTTIAKDIIDSTLYMVLGTSDEAGQPWVSPVSSRSVGELDARSARFTGSKGTGDPISEPMDSTKG